MAADTPKDPTFYTVIHPLSGESTQTIVEATSMAKARAHVEKGLIQARRSTQRELLDCGGKTEKAE